MSFYSPPKPWALLPIRLVDTARDVNEMQRGIRLASHLQCAPPQPSPPTPPPPTKSSTPLSLSHSVLLSGLFMVLCFCVSIHRLAALSASVSLLTPPPTLAPSLPSPWLGSRLLSPQTPHIPVLPWLLACIPGHGDSTGSHNPRQPADLGWATDSQRLGRGEEQGLGNDGVRG